MISLFSRKQIARFCMAFTASTLSFASAVQAQAIAEVEELMSKMTLHEKIGQLNQLIGGDINTGSPQNTNIGRQLVNGEVGSILNTNDPEKILALQRLAVEKSRLHIPLLVGLDVVHGYQTIFPLPLGMAATWDIEKIEKSARIAAIESSANGIGWTFSPMVDICIDPRWGRQAEGAGEDPYLGSLIAQAFVRGYQGVDLTDKASILACVKHFALYGAAESGRDYNTVDMSRLRMYNQFLPPYKAAIDAGVGTVMSSFNVVDYVPATANKWLLTDLLRREWAFKGMVVTDYASIDEMESHGMGNKKSNAVNALKAGTDMEMVSQAFITTLEESLKEGLVTQEEIDRACRNVLTAKYKLGLFANPYKYLDGKVSKDLTYCKAHKEFAREFTAESFVLLKNKDNLLPLQKKGTIALIGPLAQTRDNITGSWSVAQAAEKYTTLFEGFQRALKGKAKVVCAQGSNFVDNEQWQDAVTKGHGNQKMTWLDDEKALAEAVDAARNADVIICAVGECAWMNGEGTSRADLSLPAPQHRLLAALSSLGKPVVMLNFAGRATVLNWENDNIDAILNVWYGSECADALVDVLFGDANPCGRLTVSMPRSSAQLPIYYNHLNTGRPVADDEKEYKIFMSNYQDVRNGALFPFGFGLSYTTFEYSPVRLSATTMDAKSSLKASVTVTNTGKREGTEVVQLYLHDKSASISRPVKELKSFKRITLKAGESRTVEFEVTEEMLKFYNQQLQFVAEPGAFEIFIGPDSSTRNKAEFCFN